MPVESAFPPPFPQILCVCVCVCVWGGGGGGWMGGWVDVQARVSACEWVSVCLLHPSISIFSPAFVLVNNLSLVSRCFLFWKCVRFCFCCCLFLSVVCTCILCLLPCLTRCSFTDVLSCTPTGVSEINHLTWHECMLRQAPTFSCVSKEVNRHDCAPWSSS